MKRSLKLNCLVVIYSCFVFGTSLPQQVCASASKTSHPLLHEMPNVLSYEQLMRLPQGKRLQYLKGLQAVLTYLESRTLNKRDKLVVQHIEHLRRDLLSRLVSAETAFADDAADAIADMVHPARSKSRSIATPEDPFENKILSARLRCGDLVKGERQWSCDLGDSTASRKIQTCTTEQRLKNQGACGDNELIVNKKVGTCALKTPVEYQSSCPIGFAGARVQGESGFYCVPVTAWGDLSEQRRKEIDVQKGGGPSMEGLFNKNDCESVLRRANVRAIEEADKLPPVADARKEAVVQPPTPEAPKCDPVPPECKASAEELKKFKKAFYGSKEARCIFTGNIREYDTVPKQPGHCSAPYEIRVAGKPYRCKDKQMIVCNPLLYGVQGDGSAVCVPGRGRATANCGEESGKLALFPDFLDQLNQDIPGIKDAWEEFRKGFNDLCKGPENVSAKFFCDECREMAKRLVVINSISVDPSNCGEVFSADQYVDSMKKRRDEKKSSTVD